jgi:hypothetical protein
MQNLNLFALFGGYLRLSQTTLRWRNLCRLILILLMAASLSFVHGQENPIHADDQITLDVNTGIKMIVPGYTVPSFVTASTDMGRLSPYETIGHLMLVLRRPAARQSAFEKLLNDLYSADSPRYHQWLTPSQIGADYGTSNSDIGKITAWLNSCGLRVEEVSDSRQIVTFTGTSDQLEKAFSTELHRYKQNGIERISINRPPGIPQAFGSVVETIIGLSTISNHPTLVRSNMTQATSPSPLLNVGSEHAIFPGDFAAIYDLNLLYVSGINGAGQKVAIVGESRVANEDIEDLEALAGSPIKDPVVVIPTLGTDPQMTGDSLQLESTLDVDRVLGTAPGADVSLVVSASNANGDGVQIATQYAIQNNLAQIMSISFGACEASAGKGATLFYDTLFSQAAAQGISVFVSSGDSAAAGCDTSGTTPPLVQQKSINYICASGYATCLGGTEFVEGSGQYWGTSNSSTYASALKYVPEGAWNDSSAETVEGTGGGASLYIPKPSWQTGVGVPSDGARDTPDIALSASANHDPYAICAAFEGSSCQTGQFEYLGGTSAAAPGMAGIQALVNQHAGGALGNINPLLYRSAANTSLNIFHDITPATSGVANCVLTAPSLCNNSTSGPPALLSSGVQGYAVTAGYDEATGLGSIDGFNWVRVAAKDPALSTPTLTVTANPQLVGDQEHGLASTLTATLANATNPFAPITITATCIDGSCSPITLGSGVPSDGALKVTYTFPALGRAYSITASYTGDINNTSATSAPVFLTARQSSSGIQSYINLVPNQTQVDTTGKTRNFSITVTINGSLQEGFTQVSGLILVGKVQLLVDGVPTNAIASVPGVGYPNPGTVTISSSLPDYLAHLVSVLYYTGTLDPCGCVAAGYAPDGPAASSVSQAIPLAFAGASPANLTFGSQATATTSPAQTVTLQSSTQTGITISSISLTGTNAVDFAESNTCGTSVAAGANCTISVTFTPSAEGSRIATLTITDNASGSPQTVALSGSGVAPGTPLPMLTLSATNLTFSSQTDGTTSAAQTVTMTNSGQATLTLNSIAASGDYAQTNNCGSSVAPGANCTISVTFTPSAAGSRTGTLTITDNASGSPQAVTLSGTGVATPGVTLSPTSLTFASQTDGTTSATQTVTLTNSGTAALMITSIAASGDFAQTNTCGTSVATGANCTISVTFTPTASGNRTGALSITDSASGSPQSVALSGVGAAVSMSSTSTGLTISSPGGSTTASIQLSSVDGFTGTVSLTCAVSYQGQGIPSSPPSCALSPSQVQVTGSSPVSSTLTVSTTSASASVDLNRSWRGTGFALAALLFLGVLPRRHLRGGLLLLALCLVTVGGILGCSGSGGGSNVGGGTTSPPANSGTTAGNYQVVVTATSGTVTTTTTIPMSLQ